MILQGLSRTKIHLSPKGYIRWGLAWQNASIAEQKPNFPSIAVIVENIFAKLIGFLRTMIVPMLRPEHH